MISYNYELCKITSIQCTFVVLLCSFCVLLLLRPCQVKQFLFDTSQWIVCVDLHTDGVQNLHAILPVECIFDKINNEPGTTIHTLYKIIINHI